MLTLPEHQCKPHPSTYGFRGVGNLFWMDGRGHPDETAPYTWQGFPTGHFEGKTLVVETDHLKAGWIRRNGLALSDQASLFCCS